jgi:hypothetical protein
LDLFAFSTGGIGWKISWYFRFLFLGGIIFVLSAYAILAAIETVIFSFGLSPSYSRKEKWLAALWLKACSVPLVTMAMFPLCVAISRQISSSESIIPAPIAGVLVYGILTLCLAGLPAVFEIYLFQLALRSKRDSLGQSLRRRDVITILVANICTSATFYFTYPWMERATWLTWNVVGDTMELKNSPEDVEWERENPRFGR